MQESFSEFQIAVAALIPGEMIYAVELRPIWKEGATAAQAVQIARNRKLIHKRGSAEAPAPLVGKGGRPRLVGTKRKPLWELNYIQARIKAAIFAILVEAETHRLEADAVDYVRSMKRKLLE